MKKSIIENPLPFPISSIAFMGSSFLENPNIKMDIDNVTQFYYNTVLSNSINNIYTLYDHIPEPNKESAIIKLEYLLSNIDTTLNLLGLYKNDISVNVIDDYINIQIDNLNKIAGFTTNTVAMIQDYDKISEAMSDYRNIVNNPGETIKRNIVRDIYGTKVNGTVIIQIITLSNFIPNADRLKNDAMYALENGAEAFNLIKSISGTIHSLRDSSYIDALKIKSELFGYISKFKTLVTKEKKVQTNKEVLDILVNVNVSLNVIKNALNKYIVFILGDTKAYKTSMAKIQTALDDSSITLEALESPLVEASETMPEVVESIYEIHNFLISNLMIKNMENYSIDVNNIKYSNPIFNRTIMESIVTSIQNLDTVYRFMYLNRPKDIAPKSEYNLETLLQSKEGKKDLYKKVNRVYQTPTNEISYERTYTSRLLLKEELQKAILSLTYKLDITRKTEAAPNVINTNSGNKYKDDLDALANVLSSIHIYMNPNMRYVYQMFGFEHMYLDFNEYRSLLKNVSLSVKSSDRVDYTKKIGNYERSLDTLRDLLKAVENSLYMVDFSLQHNIPLMSLKDLA